MFLKEITALKFYQKAGSFADSKQSLKRFGLFFYIFSPKHQEHMMQVNTLLIASLCLPVITLGFLAVVFFAVLNIEDTTLVKGSFFYGLKVHAIVSNSGTPICFECSPGSTHGLTAFKEMNMEFIEDGILYGEAAYNDYELEAQLRKAGLELMVDRKNNPKRPHPPEVAKQISRKRKGIETCFSGILKLFPRTLYAVKPSGLLLKLTLFFGAFSSIAIT